MAESASAQGIKLNISGEYVNTLDLSGFSQMLKDPSYCYKFYWLEAIVKLISEGVQRTTMEAVIDEMIANAWYSVCEFHIHLTGLVMGEARDGLERAVNELKKQSGLPANASKTQIKNAIAQYRVPLHKYKLQLTNMVPYRALAGFFKNAEVRPYWEDKRGMTDLIRQVDSTVVPLPYIFGEESGLNKEIIFHPTWMKMIQDNTVPILGWIQVEKLAWLQTGNPEVPGLVFKLSALDEKVRKLEKVRALWQSVFEQVPVRDIYTQQELNPDAYDVDHFIPWSFVMNDELWNLMPMDSSLNSSKSNLLPAWDPFFERFGENQYKLYTLIQSGDAMKKRFVDCTRDNLHSLWAGELYRPGNSREEFLNILQKNMQPVYDSARRQGYELWQYKGKQPVIYDLHGGKLSSGPLQKAASPIEYKLK